MMSHHHIHRSEQKDHTTAHVTSNQSNVHTINKQRVMEMVINKLPGIIVIHLMAQNGHTKSQQTVGRNKSPSSVFLVDREQIQICLLRWHQINCGTFSLSFSLPHSPTAGGTVAFRFHQSRSFGRFNVVHASVVMVSLSSRNKQVAVILYFFAWPELNRLPDRTERCCSTRFVK